MILWNARGIRKKAAEFFDFLLREKVDIALVSETWLTEGILIRHSEFVCHRRDRTGARGGGVMIVVQKNISHELLDFVHTNLIENIGIRVNLADGSSVHIFSCYFPGGAAGPSDIKKQKFKDDLLKFSRIKHNYILGGDFNSRHQNWGCLRANCWGNIIHDLITVNRFDINYPPDPTYVPTNCNNNASVLDIYLTNIPNRLTGAQTLNRLNSDHLPVCAIYNASYKREDFLKFDYKNANWNAFREYINSNANPILQASLDSEDDINSNINNFTKLLNEAINSSVPKKNISNTYIQRLPESIIKLIKLRNKFRRDWIRYRQPVYKSQMLILNNIINERIFKFRNLQWNNFLKNMSKSSSKFWNVSKIIKKKTKILPSLKENGNIYTTTIKKAELLAKTFALNHNITTSLSNIDTQRMVANSKEIVNSHVLGDNYTCVNSGQIKMLIDNLLNKKAPGIDGISNQCLKQMPTKGHDVLCRIFTACLKLSYFPLVWKQSKTIAIPKPGKDPSSPDSYRPISLLNTMSKLLEKIIKNKIINHLDIKNILPPQQFGFRAEHNTIQPLVRIRNIVKENFAIGKSTAMILLDVKAAFDSVWHDGLIHKLLQIEMDMDIIKIIESFLSDRSFKVHIGNIYSQAHCIAAGCPQGSCLSPILYNIFTHDFPVLDGCSSSIFADDTAILTSDVLAEDIICNIERSVNVVIDYFKAWKIIINSDKTKAIYFTRKRKSCFTPQTNIKLGNVEICWEDKVKYLGVILDKKLIFNEHINYIVHKINITIKIMYPLINRKSGLSIFNKTLILKSIFHAILFYAAPVWYEASDCHLKRLQICQNKILKIIYDLPRDFSTRTLHEMSNVKLVKERLNLISENFKFRCQNSTHVHIQSLY